MNDAKDKKDDNKHKKRFNPMRGSNPRPYDFSNKVLRVVRSTD